MPPCHNCIESTVRTIEEECDKGLHGSQRGTRAVSALLLNQYFALSYWMGVEIQRRVGVYVGIGVINYLRE